jgi:hypothetical protein
MKTFLKKLCKDFFSEPDGVTYCPIRILAFLGFMSGMAMSAYSVFMLKAVFDMVAYGTSYGLMLGALGIALGLKTDATKGVIAQ